MHYTYFHKAGQKLLGHTWEIGPKTQFVLHTALSALLPTISNEFWKVFWVTLIGHLGPLMTCSEFRYIPIDNTFPVPTLRHMCT